MDHVQRKSLKGYPCLDPFVIIGQDVQDGRAAKNLICWMFVCLNWLSRMVTMDADSPVVMPSPQHWRDFLVKIAVAMGLEVRRTGGGGQWGENHGDSVVMRSFFEKTSALKAPVNVWGKQLVRSAQDIWSGEIAISLLFAKEIVWDLFEHNFWMELLSLDRVLVPCKYMSGAQCAEWEAKVADVVPQGLFTWSQLSLRDEGLAGRLWEDRMEYVEAFRELLSTWPGSTAGVLAVMLAGL